MRTGRTVGKKKEKENQVAARGQRGSPAGNVGAERKKKAWWRWGRGIPVTPSLRSRVPQNYTTSVITGMGVGG